MFLLYLGGERTPHASARLIGGRQAGRVEFDAADPKRLKLHFRLPFVDLSQGLGGQCREKSFLSQRDEARLRLAKLPRSETFGTFGGDDQRPSRFKNGKRGHHAFDRLVVRFVEWVAGRRGHHGRELPWQSHAGRAVDELDCRGVAGDDLAEAHEDQIPLLVEHGVQAIDVAEHADDFELLLVQSIADEVALDGKGILHESRGMEGADRLMMSNARHHDFPAAGPTGHEVRLNQARRDFEVGFDEEPI